MITEQMIYWITRLDNMLIMSAIILVGGAVTTVAGIIRYHDHGYSPTEDEISEHRKIGNKFIMLGFIIMTISGLSCVFIPDTKTMIAIKIIPKIANNEEIKGLTDKTMQLINGKLDEWISNVDIKSTDTTDKP